MFNAYAFESPDACQSSVIHNTERDSFAVLHGQRNDDNLAVRLSNMNAAGIDSYGYTWVSRDELTSAAARDTNGTTDYGRVLAVVPGGEPTPFLDELRGLWADLFVQARQRGWQELMVEFANEHDVPVPNEVRTLTIQNGYALPYTASAEQITAMIPGYATVRYGDDELSTDELRAKYLPGIRVPFTEETAQGAIAQLWSDLDEKKGVEGWCQEYERFAEAHGHEGPDAEVEIRVTWNEVTTYQRTVTVRKRDLADEDFDASEYAEWGNSTDSSTEDVEWEEV